MTKLKVAKAIRAAFMTLKYVVITALILGVLALLWWWAVSHFLSFGIVIGIILGVFLLGGIISAWEWSGETIEEAQKEERRAQERNRIEKERRENPDKFVPLYEDDYDPTDPLGEYR